MEESAERLVILLSKEEMVAIDDFRFQNRMRNRSDAVRALLKLALNQDPRRPSKATVTFGADSMSVYGVCGHANRHSVRHHRPKLFVYYKYTRLGRRRQPSLSNVLVWS